ncbi:MAG: SGNH/GDSL hydrolase family protein, partial [Actinomycetes bacterium]
AFLGLMALVAFFALRDSGNSATTSTEMLIAVGDSYAAGYQPNDPTGMATSHGFVDRLAVMLNKDHPAKVLNFACSGATTETVLSTSGCTTGAQANNAPIYATTQLDAAVDALSTHRGHVRAVVVALGINDFARCAGVGTVNSCVERQAPKISERLRQILVQLRRAGGPSVPIVGITYPNVGLIGWKSSPPNRIQAETSLELTTRFAHPAILSAYQGLGLVADVTKASGGLDPLPASTSGPEPKAISTLCVITWMCRQGDLHLTPEGQDFVAKVIATRLNAKP